MESVFISKESKDAILEAHQCLVEIAVVDPKAKWVTENLKAKAQMIRRKLEKMDFVSRSMYGGKHGS
jgi:hypothetical protein